ncbi:ALQxL family class IV lanthipeptide [Streptomyces sp. NPDC059456]|uniref:ALQxL family class IV lanthipeptide n=1 Tax=Streptomyces sp. NPDC059456 TaxID=3346838 RepID=UPI003679E932
MENDPDALQLLPAPHLSAHERCAQTCRLACPAANRATRGGSPPPRPPPRGRRRPSRGAPARRSDGA